MVNIFKLKTQYLFQNQIKHNTACINIVHLIRYMDYAAMAHHSAAAMANPDPLHYLHHHHQESVRHTFVCPLQRISAAFSVTEVVQHKFYLKTQ